MNTNTTNTTNTVKAVKAELLAQCSGGDLTKGGWAELYSPRYTHPYNDAETSDDYVRACGGNRDAVTINTIVGPDRIALNDDIDCIADRMTCGIGDCDGDKWDAYKDDFADAVKAVLADGVTRMRTIADDSDNFATFRFSALAAIPNAVPPTCRTEMTEGGCPDLNDPMPERAFAMLANAVRAANGLAPLPLPPETFRVRFARIDEGYVSVSAASAEEALTKARAMGERDGVWLQSDPDRTAGDWNFDIVD